MKIYIDGKYYSKDEAKISVFDHGLLYGDGIFEGIRIYNGKAFLLQAHIKRLFECAKAIMLEIPHNPEELIDIVKKSIQKNDMDKSGSTGYIRLVITRGVGDLGLDPAKCEKAGVIIITDQISLYPADFYDKGIKIITSSVRRNSPDSIDPKIKSLNYLNNILAKIEAKNSGCLEAIILNKNGYVAECTGDNIFIIKDGIICTPDISNGALNGITRSSILEISQKSRIETKEGNLTLFDIYNADECFLTGSGAEIMPVTEVDSRTIGSGIPGETTKKLLDSYRNIVNQYSYEQE